jgi:hypothetical protein
MVRGVDALPPGTLVSQPEPGGDGVATPEPVIWETPSWMPLTNGWHHDFPRDRWDLYRDGVIVGWLACELLHSMGLVGQPEEAARRLTR